MPFNLKKNQLLLILPVSPWRWTAPSLGIAYIGSALEGTGFKVKLIDCQITPGYRKKILSLLADYPSVGISVNAGNVSSALDIAREIRNHSPSTRIIMGGPHATAVYERLIPEYADIVVRGEGEDTIVELMQQDDLSSIKGIAYWDKELKLTPARPYIQDLDALRFPAWHLYELKRYRLGNTFTPLAIVMTSRGCPYDCIYCVKYVHGYKVRLRSVDNVLNEIDQLVSRFGIREIQIMDDVFTI
ncbi:MAG: cobalamin-dependent protein, partial [Candidatus Omnitrophota bacterium]